MANKTVIDELIVALKLDPKEFDKGTKQVAASVLKAKKEVRSATDDMSKGAESAAKSFSNAGGVIGKVFSRGGAIGLAIAVAVAAGKKFNDMLYSVAENTRRLGNDARSYNISAAGLRNLQNAAELAGGSLEDANQSAGSLVKSLFDLKFNGAVSDQLVQLARLGVQFQNANGSARDFKDVTLDTAEALEKLQRSGQMSRADAIQYAQGAGFSGGMAQLVAGGRGGVESALAKQEARRQVNGGDVGAATDRVNAYLSLGQAAESNLGVPAMTAESPTMTGLSRTSESAINGMGGAASAIGDTLTVAVDTASMALGDLADATKRLGAGIGSLASAQGAWFRGRHVYGQSLDATADKYGIDRSVFRGIARTESNYDPNAVGRDKQGNVTARGIMQLNPKYFPNAGKDPYSDIDTAGKHFASLLNQTEGLEQDRYVQALRMYHAGATNVKNGTNIGPANRAYAGRVLQGTPLALPTPTAQGNAAGGRGDVTIESVTVNSRGTDGQTLANDFVNGVVNDRKLMAAQADGGMQ